MLNAFRHHWNLHRLTNRMLELVRAGTLRPDLLVTATIPLDATPAALTAMGTAPGSGVTVIEPWTDRP